MVQPPGHWSLLLKWSLECAHLIWDIGNIELDINTLIYVGAMILIVFHLETALNEDTKNISMQLTFFIMALIQ
jgi:hypothetical protein